MAMVFLCDRQLTQTTNNNQSAIYNNSETLNLISKINNNNNSDISLLNSNNNSVQIPFNIHGKGHLPLQLEGSGNVPGPGSYNISSNLKKPILNYSNNIQFLAKSPRFKLGLYEFEENPGPGSYDITTKPKIKKGISMKPNNEVSFKYNTNSLNNIATIPTKKQQYGYLENDEGELIQAINPSLDECFSGEKNNSVGPDRYNPVHKEKNVIVSWNKMSPRKLNAPLSDELNNDLFSKNTIGKDESFENLTKMSKLETDISSIKGNHLSENLKKEVKQRSMKHLIDNYKKNLYHSKIPQNIGSKKSCEDEGYDEEKEIEFLNHEGSKKIQKFQTEDLYKPFDYPLNFNALRYHFKPEEHQFFGSSAKRGLLDTVSDNDHYNFRKIKNTPGPGSYFRNTFQKYQNKQNEGKNLRVHGKNRSSVTLKRSASTNIIGPGSYNISTDIIKKSYNCNGSFSTEKRFPGQPSFDNTLDDRDLNSKVTPGPGSYELQDLWKKEANRKIYKPIFVNAENEIRKIGNKRLNENKSDFNKYQTPGLINIIQSDILKKNKAFKNVPFYSNLGRFVDSKDTLERVDLGPGKYYDTNQKINKINSKHPLKKIPFYSTEERKMDQANRNNENLSPGEYYREKYFDWNKKSFNVMFA